MSHWPPVGLAYTVTTRSVRSTRANTQPAYGCYLAEVGEPAFHPAGLLVLTLAGDRIRGMTRFFDDDLLRRFA